MADFPPIILDSGQLKQLDGADNLLGRATSAMQIVVSGLTTTGMAAGDFGYISAANVVSKSDSATIATARLVGVNEGTAGSMTVSGLAESAKLTTAGGSPANGAAVFLAAASDDTNTGAGKLTAAAPTSGVVREVGIVIDNTNYAALKTCKVLLHPVALVDLVGGGGGGGGGSASGWTDDGAIVRLTTSGDTVAVGAAAMAGSEKLRVVGDERVEGSVLIAGSTSSTFVNMTAGQSAAVAAASEGRIRYNATTQKFQLSENGGAYADLGGGGGASGWADDGAIVRLTTAGDTVSIGAAAMSGSEKLRVVGSARVEGDAELKTHSAFAGSEAIATTAAAQTTNATATQLKTVALSDNSVYLVKARVTARGTAGTKRAAYERTCLVYREAAGAAILGGAGVQADFTDETTAAWDATFTVSGNDLRLTVTGEAATTINWACVVEYQRVSGSA